MTIPFPRDPSRAHLSFVRGETPIDAPNPAAGDDVIDTRALTYSVDQVAGFLGVSRGTAYEYVQSGEIPAIRLGRRWLVPRTRFHAWLNGKAS